VTRRAVGDGSTLNDVDRVVLVARLKPDVRDRAVALLTGEAGERLHEERFQRGAVFLSESEVVFLVEGNDASETVRTILDDPAESTVIGHWLPLFDGPLHRAREAHSWET
jgi:hypothetical protein